MEPYKTEPVSQEEMVEISTEITKVLEKYNAEIGIVSTLQILKRVQESPYVQETTDTKAEESSVGSDEEPAE